MLLNYVWVGEFGNLTNYGLAKVGDKFAFVWTDTSLPKSESELQEMGFDSESGSEIYKTLAEAIEAAEECFEYVERSSGELLESLKKFKKEEGK